MTITYEGSAAMSPSLLLLGLLWLTHFTLHSLGASLWLKNLVAQRHPAWMPGYRLLFNLQASLLLLPPLGLMWWLGGEPLWRYTGAWNALRWLLMLLALIGFVGSLRYYDGGEFLGIKQLREGLGEARDQERLQISPLHRFVRHPWYSLALVVIWCQEMDGPRLLSALLVSAYLLIGSWLEERKLMIYHGERYRRYRARVAGLVPLPWRILTKAQAEELLRE